VDVIEWSEVWAEEFGVAYEEQAEADEGDSDGDGCQ
jgi:hypothetical protein